jgi:PAS domain S-box-containing protein
MANKPDADLRDLVSAIENIGVHDHLCLIYETREEQFSAVIPFIKIGLERGEQCVYIVDDNTAAMVIDRMKEAGIDVESAVGSGKLIISSKQDAYLKQGFFDPDWMIGFLKQATDAAKTAGFSALRVTGEMTWVLGGDPGTERLMEYEAKLNYFFPEHDALAICQYNRDFFPPGIIKDVIATHPLVICGGMVCSNFYYIPPDDFLGDQQPDKEIDRLLANIINRKKVEDELRRHREQLEELVRERTAELRRLNRELRAISNCNQVLVRAEDELSLYRDICRIICDEAGYRMAWVGNAEDDDARTIRPVAWAGVEDGYLAEARITWADTELGRGPSGIAIRSGESACIQDFTTSPQAAPWRDNALQRGYRSSIALPLKDENTHTFAVLNIYSSEPNTFTADETRLMEELSGDLAFGAMVLRARAERKRAEEALYEAQQMYRALIENSPDIIARYDRDCRRTYVNPTYLKVARISQQELLATAPEERSPLPAASATVLQNLLHRVLDSGVAEAVDVIWPKPDNIDYWYNIYAFPEFGREGQIVSVMTVSRDITRRKQAEEKILLLNEELEQRVRERTKELERRNRELEQMNKAFVGREMKMVELKKRIQELENRYEGHHNDT